MSNVNFERAQRAYQTFLAENSAIIERLKAANNKPIKAESVNESPAQVLAEIPNAMTPTRRGPGIDTQKSDWQAIRSHLHEHGYAGFQTPRVSPQNDGPIEIGNPKPVELASARSEKPVSLAKDSTSIETWSMGVSAASVVGSVVESVPPLDIVQGSSDAIGTEIAGVGSQFPENHGTLDLADRASDLEPASAVTWEWLQRIGEAPDVRFLTRGVERIMPTIHQCDIDTNSGMPLPVIEYPDTAPQRLAASGDEDDGLAWRQQNMSSTLYIKREITSREKLARTLRSKLQRQAQQSIHAAEQEQEDAWPQANCLVRPAEPQDFEAIAAIWNAETTAETSPQAFGAVTVGDIEDLYMRCRHALRPFVVAIPSGDELLDRSKWPKGAGRAYQEYVQFRKSLPVQPPRVVGFALITDVRNGLSGAPCPGSRHSGLIQLAVSAEHRQKLYGSALLDRILLCVTAHRSVVEYKWEGHESSMIYDKPYTHNRRQYARVYIEVFSAGKDDPELAWRAKMLDKFEFQRVAYLSDAVKTDRHHQSTWMDLSLWQLEAQQTSKIADKPVGGFLEK